ncbi:Ubiquitin carboxyl-terminal hydrolase 20 [Stylophora pistillata]|uniref:Ubiquitin carboxyl-terminal hydrolase n=1 Tax=Stylophora pistillata TaxID=50429 RepID=A0A2B4SD69_STYPI|nr:Ubiquitin carboxyl-terminal hydrolase 20 [Stylophora pistillata]
MPSCPHLNSIDEVNVEAIKGKMKEAAVPFVVYHNQKELRSSESQSLGCGRFGNNHIELHNQTHEVLDMEDALELEKGLKPRGLCGLSNLGNTCYMNAALQALSNCPPLTQYFLECGSFAKETKNSSVSRNFSILVNEIWSRKRPKYVVPSQLLRSVRQINSQFRGYGQQDAQEFLRCIMDQLHEEIRQPVLSLTTDPESSDSDDEEPNHQNKRLLGGTSLSHTENLQDDDGDVDMYSESGDDAMDAKPLHVNTAEEQTDQDKETDGASKSKRRKTSTDPVDDNEVKLSVEGEPMSDDETEHHDQVDENMDNEDVALIKEEKPMDSDTMEHTRQPSDQERTKREQIAEKRKKRMKVPLNYSSIVTDLFDGTIQSSVQCLTCHRVSSRAETFQDVSLPIPGKDELTVLHASQCTPLASCSSVMDRDQDKSWMSTILEWLRSWFLGPQVTLSDCLSAFFSADELKGDNMYSCEKCKKLRNGVKLCKVMRLPEVLCIHLKRFKHEMYFSSKINHFISFPLTGLDMKPFLVKDFHKQDPTQKCTTYDLVAIITHHGNVGAGHYVTFAKNYINGKWYEFNDSWVSEVSDSFVADVEAYVLFYRKSSDEATRERQTFFNLLKDAQTHESRYFVSKKWLTKFQSCMEPDPQHTTTLARINGKEEKENPPEETKKMMDNLLKEKFAAGHRVAIIHHLELLPPPSPILFYSYCDDQNAPHKHVAVIFTVHMPVEPSPSLSPKEAEGSVEKYLSGPITNSDFLCRHGAVHPLKFEKIHEITVPLPQSVWVHLLNRFGGGPPATTLNICRHCKRALDELERRRQREMETFKRLNHDYPANENVDVYFISLRWFKLWEVFVKGQEDVECHNDENY